jgi:hypothetical protein
MAADFPLARGVSVFGGNEPKTQVLAANAAKKTQPTGGDIEPTSQLWNYIRFSTIKCD